MGKQSKPAASGPAVATPALAALSAAGVTFIRHEYQVKEVQPHQAGYGLAAATALGVAPARVFKTLIAAGDKRLVVGMVPSSAQLSLKALAAALGEKRLEMATPAAAQRATGYVTGGISPLGQKQDLAMVLDASAEEHATIFVSGGRRGLSLELSPAELRRLTGATSTTITAAR